MLATIQVHGSVVFPGAAHLEMVRSAAAIASDATRLLNTVFFVKPLTLDSACMSVDCAISHGRFEVRSTVADLPEDQPVHCSGFHGGFDGVCQSLEHASLRGLACSHPSDVPALYDVFHVVGLHYGPGYRTLVQAWSGSGSASARLQTRPTREGTHVHPADIDDALCMSAVIDSRDKGGSDARLPFAVDEARFQRAPHVLWAVRATTRPCPCYLLNGPCPCYSSNC